MSIYRSLDFGNKSFSSRVLDTVNEQAEAKQLSIDKMNETLRTEAAQGRLGNMANNILESALAQASEQGLIGVNQYDIMNKAMPEFYKIKSSITELNNSFNAELEAAKADKRIRVDGAFMNKLNEKYYGNGELKPEDISSHTANAVSSQFNILSNRESLNFDVIGTEFESQVGNLSMSEEMQDANGNFYMQTTQGKNKVTPAGAKLFMQNKGTQALVMEMLGVDSPADITPENAAEALNTYLETKSAKSFTRGQTYESQEKQRTESQKNAIKLQYIAQSINQNESQRIASAQQAIQATLKLNESMGIDTPVALVVEEMKTQTDPNTGKLVYNPDDLDMGAQQFNSSNQKLSAPERENIRNQETADKIYADKDFLSMDGIRKTGGQKYGDVLVRADVQADGSVAIQLTRGSEDVGEEIIIKKDKNGKPVARDVKQLQDALVTQALGAAYKDTESSIPTNSTADPDNPLRGQGENKYN